MVLLTFDDAGRPRGTLVLISFSRLRWTPSFVLDYFLWDWIALTLQIVFLVTCFQALCADATLYPKNHE
jgi:hypothetical protein